MRPLPRLLIGPLNHLLADAPWATERLRKHAGLHVLIRAGGLQVPLAVDGGGYFRGPEVTAEPDVTIEFPADFWLMAVVDRNRLLASARLSGSADAAETLAFVFRNLRWDVEADLARWVGDIPAHRLVRGGEQWAVSLGDAGRRAMENAAEYLSEDSGLLASPQQLEQFVRAVDVLRDDLARLEKRLARLT